MPMTRASSKIGRRSEMRAYTALSRMTCPPAEPVQFLLNGGPESPVHVGTRHVSERRETPRSDLGAERFEDLGGVAVGLDVVPGAFDAALLVDQEGRAQHPDAGLAEPGLLPPGAVGVHDLVVGVGQQGELEAVLVAEALVALGVVAGDADDRH